MIIHLKSFQQGLTVKCPIYSYELYTRTVEYDIDPKEIIVIGGMYLLHYTNLRDLIDIKVFIDILELDGSRPKQIVWKDLRKEVGEKINE